MRKIIHSITCWTVVLLSVHTLAAHAEGEKVRIAIVRDASRITISIRGSYEMIDRKKNVQVMRGQRLSTVLVQVSDNGIIFGDETFKTKHLNIFSEKEITVGLKDRSIKYRGQVDIFVDENQKLLVINTLDLESYVKGVLYHEISHRWPMEAMKAQAVATRTYAVYQMQEKEDQMYDVTSDIYSQVYGGKSAERHRTNLAVERTEGEILTFEGEILPAYFHSNSGGYTEDALEVWGTELPPLYGRADPFSRDHKGYQWKRNFRSKDVQELLAKNGFAVGAIQDIRVADRNLSGRVLELEIISRDGKMITLDGLKFREILGPNVVRSNKFVVEMHGYYFDLIGYGWGHGVGMSQWGAFEMSKQRYRYREILEFYYPGSHIDRL